MESSEVQLASSAPSRCVLRDHNHRDQCKDTQAALQKNLKDLVRDHINNCISVASDSDTNENFNSSSQTQKQSLRLRNHNKTSQTQIDNGSTMSSRQSRLLDRWAAKQAQEIVSTIKHEVELLSSSSIETVPPLQELPNAGGGSVEPPNRGASSLVQMWEAKSKSSSNINLGLTICTSRSNSGSSIVEEPSRGSEAGDSFEERCDSPCSDRHPNDDCFVDSDSDRTYRPPSSHSDASESEPVRVADIIRRLISTNEMKVNVISSINEDNNHERAVVANESREQRCTSISDQLEHRSVHQITCSPRIRGRQAFLDLICQMVSNRYREIDSLLERRAVSNFSQRGRIQSLLRLRILQRGNGVLDQRPPQSPLVDGKRIQRQGSNIEQLRERFSTVIEYGTSGQTENYNRQECNATEQPSTAAAHHQKCPEETSSSCPTHCPNSHDHEANTIVQQCASIEQQYVDPCTEMVKNTPNLSNISASNQPNENSHHREVVNTTDQEISPSVHHSLTSISGDLHQESDRISLTWPKMNIENTNLHLLDTTASMQEWNESDLTEEEESCDDEQQLQVPHYDWISDISRPRSYWEDQRRAWYEEILNTNSTNEDIRHLLERRQVSSFLDSDFRVKMDRLMMSHLKLLTHEEHDNEDVGRDRMNQLASYLQRHKDTDVGHEGQGSEEDEDEQNNEEHNYFNKYTRSLLALPWSFQDNGVVGNSDQVASTSSNQRLSSSMYYQDAHNISSSRNSTSLEMELIYDLKGHMEQLQYELSELRESIKNCIDMQVQLRESIKMKARPEERKKSLEGGKKEVCCICYEMKVNSLLYRCGHMCTCLDCGHELQWSSEQCPICRAPIVDVVRIYTDS